MLSSCCYISYCYRSAIILSSPKDECSNARIALFTAKSSSMLMAPVWKADFVTKGLLSLLRENRNCAQKNLDSPPCLLLKAADLALSKAILATPFQQNLVHALLVVHKPIFLNLMPSQSWQGGGVTRNRSSWIYLWIWDKPLYQHCSMKSWLTWSFWLYISSYWRSYSWYTFSHRSWWTRYKDDSTIKFLNHGWHRWL